MSRLRFTAGAACALLICLRPAQSQVPGTGLKPSKGPDIGFDYRAMIQEHQALINSGQVEKAVDYIQSRSKTPKLFVGADNLKKGLSLIYALAGNHDEHELVGFKHLTPRLYAFFVMAYYEKVTVKYLTLRIIKLHHHLPPFSHF